VVLLTPGKCAARWTCFSGVVTSRLTGRAQ
jgi:hypothetical protein